MKHSYLSIRMLILSVLMISSSTVFAQDWPQWRGVNRDGKADGFNAPKTWPSELTQVWKITAGLGNATPLITGNKIFIFFRLEDNEVLKCLDAASGSEIWQSKYPALAITGPSASQHAGPRSTPAIGEGKIVTYGIEGILTCFDASNGKVMWRIDNSTDAVPQFFTAMSPLIVDGMCIAITGGRESGEVIALDLSTGNEKWKWNGDGPAYASPVLMTVDGVKQVVAQTVKNISGLNLTNGKLLWQVATPTQQRFYNATSPYINGQTVIITGQGTGAKAVKITKQGDQFSTQEIWNNPEVGAKWNTPVLKDGFLYGLTDGRKVYCINAESGKTAWIDEANNSDFGSTVDCGSVILTLTSTGNLIVIQPDANQYTEVTRYKVTDNTVFAHPVISGNSIYIKDRDSLILYKL